MKKWFIIGMCLIALGISAETNVVKQMVATFTTLGGEPEVVEETDRYVRLVLGDSVTVELFKAGIDDDKHIVLFTACAPMCSSRAHVYTKEWEYLYPIEPSIHSIFPLATMDKKSGQLTWTDNDTWEY